MDTTNIAIVAVIAVIAFFTGAEYGEYKVKAEARAALTELFPGLAK